ncbi:helix-turn-helix domain-containing protein [Lactobacillus sp. 23-2]|uniref:helix-turn-helix domain-containing protein n=1 Tax=Lactobacillus sp. 23-2 TaxID=2981842 RepID=UPI003836DC2A
MIGQIFKQLRKSKHLTLSAVAHDIISISQLSRWENGTVDIPLNIFLALLARINVSPREFLSMTAIEDGRNNSFFNQLAILYRQKQSDKVYQLFLENIASYHRNNNVDHLFQAAATANIFYDLTKKNCFSAKDKAALVSALTSSEHWNLQTIRALGNSVFILPVELVFDLSNKLLNDLNYLHNLNFELYLDAWVTIINSDLILIIKNFGLAQKLFKNIKKIALPPLLSSIKIRISFLELLIEYKVNHDSHALQSFLDALELIGMADLKDDLLSEWALIDDTLI